MKRLQGCVFSTLAAVVLLLLSAAHGYAADNDTKAPPIAQPLVREGDLAMDLVPALKLGGAENEARAEDVLTKAGIGPKNGWVADYPVTPDIVGELETSVSDAADSGKLSLNGVDATAAFRGVVRDEGLYVSDSLGGQTADSGYAYNSGSSGDNGPSERVYYDPSAIEQYYDEYGPPVVTYYDPPYDYAYLYSWVPYPFWWDAAYGWPWFGGFFVLNDFDRDVFTIDHHRHHHWRSGFRQVSNHVVDPVTHQTARVDPVNRSTSNALATVQGSRGFGTTRAGSGAAAIVNHSTARSGGGFAGNTFRGDAGRPGGDGTPFASGTGRSGGVPAARSGFAGGTFEHQQSTFHSAPASTGRSFSAPPQMGFSGGSSFHSFSGGGFAGHGGGGFASGGFHGGGFGGHGGGHR